MSTITNATGSAIRSHISSKLSAIATELAWQNIDNREANDLPPVPKASDRDNTSYAEVYVQPNSRPWGSPGYADQFGVVLVKSFTPLHSGIGFAERRADTIESAFRKADGNHTFDSGAGVFQPPELKDIGPDDRGFYQLNIRVEWWRQRAA